MVALETNESPSKVCVRSLRTQQRAKSQCTKAQTPSVGRLRHSYGLTSLTAAMIASVSAARSSRRHSQVNNPLQCCLKFRVNERLLIDINGEFDPGSGRTLAACLTHASRAERPFGVLERRTGE